MAHSSSSKKSEKEDTDSDSEDEVNRDLDSLLAEITRLNDLIDNRDSVLRDAKKMRRDLRAQLENVLTVNFRQPRVLVIHWFRL
jgi:hypothetical protein